MILYKFPFSRLSEDIEPTLKPRPKTTDTRRVLPTPTSEPKGAWMSTAPSPLIRPVSAGPIRNPNFTPRVDVDLILAEGKIHPNDPAIPLIAAIKDEINKFSLPGSTSKLTELK